MPHKRHKAFPHSSFLAIFLRYSHLGFTDNQVVAYTPKMMFFVEDEEWTVSRLLDSFGDLVQVYQQWGYGKFSARLHLAFSNTVASLDVSLSNRSRDPLADQRILM